jgi:16S rRNA processing protein RimM
VQAAVDMVERRICVGVVAGPHGVRGDVRVKSFTADPRDLVAYGPLADVDGVRVFRLKVLGAARGILRAHIEGVDDRDAAAALAGTELYVDRGALPDAAEDEYYHADLIGLRAELEDGGAFGTVRALYDFGAGDTIEIERPGGRSVVLVFSQAIVPVVDIAGGRIVVRPPEELEGRAPDGGEDES